MFVSSSHLRQSVNSVSVLRACTHLHQSFEVLQYALHRELQEVIVPQVEPSQADSGEHTEREAPQQVGIEEQQLEGGHGVKGAGINLTNLIVFEIKVPKVRREKRSISECFCGLKGPENKERKVVVFTTFLKNWKYNKCTCWE